MRPVLHLDVATAARALLAMRAAEREDGCQQILRQADVADGYTQARNHPHPVWGNGTMLAVARRYPLADEPSFDDPNYLSCFMMVLAGLKRRLGPPTCNTS